ncbi:MAG TPA: T9SS type A sorting domain-containing protein [Flavipsychrobacter sp.]
MNKLSFLTAFVLSGFCAQAQPWLEQYNGSKRTLQDIVASYESRKATEQEQISDHEIHFEKKDYHFSRWLYYWEGRTDEQGYLVSPRKHWEEAQKLREQLSRNRAAHKGTSIDAHWTFHGPENPLAGNYGLGRINVIEFHPTDTNTYMVGSPGGGIWRTTNDGGSWTALNDFLPILGVSDIDYNPQNPNTIFICTGDRDASDTYSMGVFKSTDGGTTWDTTGFQYGFTDLRKTNGLLINLVDTNSMTLATSEGVYKSYDAGATWQLRQSGFFQQILQHPSDTAIMYATGYMSFGTRQVYRSIDGGNSWQLTGSFPGTSRVEMAVTAANPAIVKVVAANTAYGLEGIYNSIDTGKTFAKIFDDKNCDSNILASSSKGDKCGGQGWYDLTIQISPVNENHVIVGGVNTWFSTDGGRNWAVANQWSNTLTGVTIVHADKHYHKFHPLNPTVLYECNDGGIYRTLAPMSSNAIWQNLSEGLGITQFYRNAVADNTSYVLGGAQDNGTKMLTGGTSKQMTGADGMDCHIDYSDSSILYTSQQYGELRRSTNGGNSFTDIQNNVPGRPDGAWITPFLIHPSASNILLVGYDKVYFSIDRGDNWTAISPDFGGNMSRIAVTPLDDDYIYTLANTQSNSVLRYTTNFGDNWIVLTGLSVQQSNISDIIVDPYHKDSLWITYRNYTGDKVAVMDVKTKTFSKFNSNLPDVPVNCIAYDEQNKTFYIGTDLGVFYREYDSTGWNYFNNGTMPNVEVFDLGINNTTGSIWAATYGRGMWSSPTHKSTVGIANTIPLATDVITIAPNPNYGTFNISTQNELLKGKTTNVRIMNMAGVTVWNNNINISNSGHAAISADLPRGTYILEVLKDNTVFAKSKMVVF